MRLGGGAANGLLDEAEMPPPFKRPAASTAAATDDPLIGGCAPPPLFIEPFGTEMEFTVVFVFVFVVVPFVVLHPGFLCFRYFTLYKLYTAPLLRPPGIRSSRTAANTIPCRKHF